MMTHLTPSRLFMVALLKWVAFAACGLLMLLIGSCMLAMGGGVPNPFPEEEITHRKPYADFVGREYRVASDVSALAWNDFPDKAKVLVISLMSPPLVRNRFVSYVTPLKPGQRVRIVDARRRFQLFPRHRFFLGFDHSYVVSVFDAGLPEGIPIMMGVNSDGVPDRSSTNQSTDRRCRLFAPLRVLIQPLMDVDEGRSALAARTIGGLLQE